MSTNYYLIALKPPHVEPPVMVLASGEKIEASIVWPDEDDPRIHVALFAGRTWIWAMKPTDVAATCAAIPDGSVIRDEYGKRYTGAEFMALVRSVERHDLTAIGTRFS